MPARHAQPAAKAVRPKPATAATAATPASIRRRRRATREERAAAGKAQRQTVPLEALGAFEPADDTRDPIAILERQEKDRLQFLLPVRHGRMATSAFAFYRGTADIMAADLATTPTSGLRAQICGDAHLANFGFYRSPDRRLVFDLNDFDETLPGPWEWDIKRLAASFALVRHSGLPGLAAVGRAPPARPPRPLPHRHARVGGVVMLDVWYARPRSRGLSSPRLPDSMRKQGERQVRSSGTGRDSIQASKKLTEEVDGERRIRSAPPAGPLTQRRVAVRE